LKLLYITSVYSIHENQYGADSVSIWLVSLALWLTLYACPIVLVVVAARWYGGAPAYTSISKCLFNHLSIHPSLYSSINLPIYLFIKHLFIKQIIHSSIHLSIYLNPSIHQSINPSVQISINQSINLSIYLSIYLSMHYLQLSVDSERKNSTYVPLILEHLHFYLLRTNQRWSVDCQWVQQLQLIRFASHIARSNL